jgi:hypothetical protein
VVILNLFPWKDLSLIVRLRGLIYLEINLAVLFAYLKFLLPQALSLDGHGPVNFVSDLAHDLSGDLLEPLNERLRQELSLLIDRCGQDSLDSALSEDYLHAVDLFMITLDDLLAVLVLR